MSRSSKKGAYVEPSLMKKVMAIFGAALLLAGVASSCSKVCECTTSVTGQPSVTVEVNLDDYPAYSKCNQMNVENTVMGITTKVECKKK